MSVSRYQRSIGACLPTHGQSIYTQVMNPSYSRSITDIGLSRERTDDGVDMYMYRWTLTLLC